MPEVIAIIKRRAAILIIKGDEQSEDSHTGVTSDLRLREQ